MTNDIINNIYLNQAKLLLQILPIISKEKCFALKGGTAINFFIRDLPRLSIDIDLTYLPIESREKTLKNIDFSLNQIIVSLQKLPLKLKIQKIYNNNTKTLIKFFVKKDNLIIKIEPNLVFRGSIFSPVAKELTDKVKNLFELTTIANILSISDIYGSKLCAFLDRQHPRDIFDIKILLENEGITENIRKSFIIYLISHNRPIYELLQPNLYDFKSTFDNEFKGMTFIPCEYTKLIKIRKKVISLLNNALTNQERKFIYSIKEGNPKWSLINIKNIENFPSIQWKLKNIQNMNQKKHKIYLEKLKKVLKL